MAIARNIKIKILEAIMNITIETILQKAVKAPSGHNMQPWKFKVGKNSFKRLRGLLFQNW
jgi:nitroreductase